MVILYEVALIEITCHVGGKHPHDKKRRVVMKLFKVLNP